MEGLGHGAFGRGIGCIGFLLTVPTLLEERARNQADTVLPEQKHLNSATRSNPEREGTGVLAFPLGSAQPTAGRRRTDSPACFARVLPEAACLLPRSSRLIARWPPQVG